MDYLSIYMLPSIGMWSNILSGNFRKFNVAYRSFEIPKIFSTNGHVERYFGMLKNKREKLPFGQFPQPKMEQTIRMEKAIRGWCNQRNEER